MTNNHSRRFEIGMGVLCFLLSLGLILALTWPWVLHFKGEFLNHWDPPFHAWKLEFIARRILAGDLFVSGGNTNMLYPHSGALYFEALQWPPAVFAAVLFGLTDMPSELVYHVTLVVFWALSAPCMFFFLRQLDCRPAASVFGAVAFCILPHRISYMVEFQMEMIFAMPLFFGFLIRFFRKQGIWDAIFAALSIWLFAVTELYEAVFAVMAVPFLALAYFTRTPSMLKSKQFWKSAAIAGVVGLCSVFVLLLPYLQQRDSGMVLRPFSEVRLHSAQPFTFFVPFGRFSPWHLNAKVDEFSQYPTLTIMALCAIGAFFWLRRHNGFWKKRTFSNLSTILPYVFFALFFGTAILFQGKILPELRSLLRLWVGFGVLFLISSIVASASHDDEETDRITFLRGFLAASVLFLFLSFGPSIMLGEGKHAIVAYTNPVYGFCRNYCMPFLSGFRVVSRFDVLVLFFLVAVSACAFDSGSSLLGGFWKRKRGVCETVACLFLLGAISVESIPNESCVMKYRRIDNMQTSPAIHRLAESRPKCTLVVNPCGPRDLEGMRMFSLLKGDWFYIYVWGGYFPKYSQYLAGLIGQPDPTKLHEELSKFYPPCLLLNDKKNRFVYKSGLDEISPDRVFFQNGKPYLDYDKIYADIADLVDSDDRFSVFRVRPFRPVSAAQKIFRSDIGKKNPVLTCSIKTEPNAEIITKMNGKEIARTTANERGFVSIQSTLTPHLLEKSSFNVFEATSGGTNLVSIGDFELTGSDGKYTDVLAR